MPSTQPSFDSTTQPSTNSISVPSIKPSYRPSRVLIYQPSSKPTSKPILRPTSLPSLLKKQSTIPSSCPTFFSYFPSLIPTGKLSQSPVSKPQEMPIPGSTSMPTMPTLVTTSFPSILQKPNAIIPTISSSFFPSFKPIEEQSNSPVVPIIRPTSIPMEPFSLPTPKPIKPYFLPTSKPTKQSISKPPSNPMSSLSPTTSSNLIIIQFTQEIFNISNYQDIPANTNALEETIVDSIKIDTITKDSFTEFTPNLNTPQLYYYFRFLHRHHCFDTITKNHHMK
jgi:hypothetical protein